MNLLRRLTQRFGFARALCVGLLIILVEIRILDPAPIEELRVRTFDTFQLLHPRTVTQNPVIIVDIDDKSLDQIGQWPWPRTRMADLVTKLSQLGAKVIAFDIIFAEPDRLSPDAIVNQLQGLDEVTREKLRASPNNDMMLAQAFRQTRVVLGESGLPSTIQRSRPPRPPRGSAVLGNDPTPFLFNFPGLLRNIPVLENAAAGLGQLSLRTERDGIVRRVPMVMQVDGNILPSLTTEIMRVANDVDTILIKADSAGVKSIVLRDFEIPTDRNGQLWVHFSHHNAARFISAVDVLEDRVPAERIAGHLVLIGTSAIGLLDVKTTPVDPVIPGVEVHAQILESTLMRSELSHPNYATPAEVIAALVVTGTIIWLVPIFGPLVILILGLMLSMIIASVSWYLYVQHQLLIDATFPLIASLLIYLVLVFTNYISEQTQRRRIRSAFSQYLSPALVERLATTPEQLVLGGEVRDLTVMFSDVRGFTSISELYKNDPQGLISLMNRLLTPLTNAIVLHKGTIDKYMGDAIMAFWNAPLDDTAHEINACEAALDMIDCIKKLNAERKREADEGSIPFIPLQIGIGLNTGSCVVGNMGSDLRFDYSALGDSVNLASRLEGQSKTYALSIIAGSYTAAAVKDKFAILEIDLIRVKGKTEPELVYALVGREELANTEQFQTLRNANIEMLTCYRRRDWDGALAALVKNRALDRDGHMQAYYDLYAERIKAFKADPPSEDWDGVYTLKVK